MRFNNILTKFCNKILKYFQNIEYVNMYFNIFNEFLTFFFYQNGCFKYILDDNLALTYSILLKSEKCFVYIRRQ